MQQLLVLGFLMMSRLAWGLASSGRAILRIRASSVRISMAEYMSGMGMGNREIDLSHLEVPNSQIDPYWIDRLRRLRGAQKQTTIASLTKQLTPDNNLGFAHGKAIIDKGSFFEYATLQRELHRDKIILLRSGEFYETYGIDAVMLVALCGLNPMGGKCKAGCPIKNVQQTLDDLTDNGLSVAVYEEVAEPEVRPGPAPKVSKKKTRALTHIVTPATKTYPYELCLRSDEIAYSPNRPYVAIMGSVSGYDLYEIRLDEQLVLCTARLTEKGVETLLRTRYAAGTGFHYCTIAIGCSFSHCSLDPSKTQWLRRAHFYTKRQAAATHHYVTAGRCFSRRTQWLLAVRLFEYSLAPRLRPQRARLFESWCISLRVGRCCWAASLCLSNDAVANWAVPQPKCA